jgi:hypothetical protein
VLVITNNRPQHLEVQQCGRIVRPGVDIGEVKAVAGPERRWHTRPHQPPGTHSLERELRVVDQH